jgi:hypothetical protein
MTTGEQDRTQDAIGDYWDALSQGRRSSAAPALDASLVDVIDWLRRLDAPASPDAAFVTRLEQQILRSSETTGFALSPPPASLTASVNGHSALESWPAPHLAHGPSRSRWALAQLATAALVLVTLLGSFVAFRGSLRFMGPPERPVILPAIDGVQASSALVEALVADWPTGGPPFFVSIQRITLDPGAVEAASTDPTGMGPELFTVEAGTVAVAADGPVFVTRGSAQPQAAPTAVPAGTTIVLEEGDQYFAPTAVSFRRRNDTAITASLLDFQITDVEPAHHAKDITYQKIMPDKVLNATPPPAQIALHRLRLLPGGVLLISELPGLQMLYVEEGTLEFLSDGDPSGLAPVSGMAISAGNGTAYVANARALANRTADPVTLVIATIDPAQ